MKKLTVLVLLYGKKIDASKTLNELFKHEFVNVDIIIWNNGPESLKQDFELLGKENFFLKETIENSSLSIVYNDFLKFYSSDVYMILDDDSNVKYENILMAQDCDANEILVPIIKCQGVIESPIVNRKPFNKEGIINQDVFAIGSGVVFGKDIKTIIKDKYNTVFDERFYFYGVDGTFFRRVNTLRDKVIIRAVKGFEHSLSRIENNKPSKFRIKERSYDVGLQLRYYLPWYHSVLSLIKLVFKVLLNSILKRSNEYNVFFIIKAYITGRHYRG